MLLGFSFVCWIIGFFRCKSIYLSSPALWKYQLWSFQLRGYTITFSHLLFFILICHNFLSFLFLYFKYHSLFHLLWIYINFYLFILFSYLSFYLSKKPSLMRWLTPWYFWFYKKSVQFFLLAAIWQKIRANWRVSGPYHRSRILRCGPIY